MPRRPQEVNRQNTHRNHIVFALPPDMDQWSNAFSALFAAARRDLNTCPDEVEKAYAEGRQRAGVGVKP